MGSNGGGFDGEIRWETLCWCWGLAVDFFLKMGSVLSSALFPMNMVFAVFLKKTFFLLGRGRGV